MAVDFTVYKNIGPQLSKYLNELAFTKDKFESVYFSEVFLSIVSHIGPEKALKGCYPRACCEALLGAKKSVTVRDLEQADKEVVEVFITELKSLKSSQKTIEGL